MKKAVENSCEECKELSLTGTWVIIVLICLYLVASGLFAHRMLPDLPRRWDYGALDMIPGQSVYSTTARSPITVAPADIGKVPQQLETLPGARPLERLKIKSFQRQEETP